MLRVVKVRSPLSLGTWILMAFGVTSGLLAARQMAEDGFILQRRSFLSRLALLLPDRLLTLIQGALGLGLGGYTGVLLAATAVPLWAAAGILLGPLFLAASITSGAAALILLGLLSGRQSRAARADLEIVASVGAITQLGLAAAHEAFVPERIGQPIATWPVGARLPLWRSRRRTDRADGPAAAGLAQWRAHGTRLLGAERDLHAPGRRWPSASRWSRRARSPRAIPSPIRN